MSFCVNCGVKLAKSEGKCPLCKTEVLNPNVKDKDIQSIYPEKIEKLSNINWNYVMKLISILLVIFGLISVICDLLIIGHMTWSIYVIGAVLYLGSLSSFLHFKKPYIPIIISTMGAELFILLIAYLNNFLNIFKFLIMPFIFIESILFLIVIWIVRRKKKNIVRMISFCLFMFSLAIISIEVLIDLYSNIDVILSWSVYVTLPILIISLGLILLSFNKKILEEIKKRIFI